MTGFQFVLIHGMICIRVFIGLGISWGTEVILVEVSEFNFNKCSALAANTNFKCRPVVYTF